MKIVITENQLENLINEIACQEFDYSDALKLEDAMVKAYGTTDNLKSVGYITPNGYLIDFGGGGYKRELDHRDINGMMDDLNIDMGKYKGEEWLGSNSTNVLAALDMGFIRYFPEYSGFNFRVFPSQRQFEILRKIINAKNGYVVVDMSDPNGHAEFTRGTPTDFIIDGIKNFFNRGEKLITYEEAYADEDLMEQVQSKKLQFDYWFDDPHLPKDLKDRLEVGKRPTW